MGIDLSLELRKAAVKRLKADAGVTTLVSASSVYGEEVKADHKWPFIRMGLPVATAFEATCWNGSSHRLTVHAFAKGPFTDAVIRISKAVVAAMPTLAVAGYDMIDNEWVSTQVVRDTDEASAYHAIIEFDVTVASSDGVGLPDPEPEPDPVDPINQFSASGGIVADIAGYRIHTFNSSGTLGVSVGGNVEILLIGGGGGGSSGGGGAGGYVSQTITVPAGSYPLVVGAGGVGGTTGPFSPGLPGGNSTAVGLVAFGGGGGGGPDFSGGDGGSGGGAGANGSDMTVPGTGTMGQGNGGGTRSGFAAAPFASGGGGGAGAVGGNAININTSGSGGAGLSSGITGSQVAYAGGGGGAPYGGGTAGIGGIGGGGSGNVAGTGFAGAPNTGGGGGGASVPFVGGAGASGVVIIRYPI